MEKIMETLGITLKKLRESRNLTIAELATKAGLGRGTIGDIETGKNKSTIATVDTLSKALGLNKKEREQIFASMLPRDIGKRLLGDDSDEFLDGLLELLKLVEVEEQKSILNLITEKVEYLSLKNGNYKQVEGLINEVKEKIEEL
ncbi:helix-turn-helix domain-containing protein [Leptotrichia massiliensis]|uniref:helix-turn-helix domain-containing protein n=1 Tax=Leptotrichia massiliensis TaxID=1852388 RepID=UPI001F48CF11|nr:helix-turn-helix transcriptional regulator [Leptotrichia massiliensis]